MILGQHVKVNDGGADADGLCRELGVNIGSHGGSQSSQGLMIEVARGKGDHHFTLEECLGLIASCCGRG
jgi:hypothetical protein